MQSCCFCKFEYYTNTGLCSDPLASVLSTRRLVALKREDIECAKAAKKVLHNGVDTHANIAKPSFSGAYSCFPMIHVAFNHQEYRPVERKRLELVWVIPIKEASVLARCRRQMGATNKTDRVVNNCKILVLL
jgi:hypothetical protein